MKQQSQGVRSTQKESAEQTPSDAPSEQNKSTPADAPPEPKKRRGDVFVKIWDTKEKIYTDQTGGFPFQSNKGNRYLMVMVEVDSNYIDAEPMKNITEAI